MLKKAKYVGPFPVVVVRPNGLTEEVDVDGVIEGPAEWVESLLEQSDIWTSADARKKEGS